MVADLQFKIHTYIRTEIKLDKGYVISVLWVVGVYRNMGNLSGISP